MKIVSLLLAIILCVCIFPVLVFSAEPYIENGAFESEPLLWSEGTITSSLPYSGEGCLTISSSSENENEQLQFSTEYQRPILLTQNTVYELSFYVRADVTENTFLPNCRVDVPSSGTNIRFQITRLTTAWHKISASFLIDRTDTYTFILDAYTDTAFSAFYIDDISLSQVAKSAGIHAMGNKTVTIPDAGTATYTYTPVALGPEDVAYPIQNGSITAEEILPSGVSFDGETGVLSVSNTAQPGLYITLLCALPGSTVTPPVSIKILLTRNVLQNGTFDDIPLCVGWDTEEAPFSVISDKESFCAHIPTSCISENVYKGSLVPERAMVLYASYLYVFRAKVRSNASYPSRNMRAQALGPTGSNLIQVEITDIGGSEWNEVVTAFQVPANGVYSISIDVFSSYDNPVYIDDIVVQSENLAPATIYFDAPMHVSRPKEGTTVIPLLPSVYNQIGMPQEASVSFSVLPDNSGVQVVDGQLSVSALATNQNYVIVATIPSNPNVQSRRTVSVSDESVGDGSFEVSAPGQAWLTAEPSDLDFVSTYKNIYPSDGSLLARLTMNGAVSMIMSDSVNRYDQEKGYVFSADMCMLVPDIDTVVTVLVDNVHSNSFDDNLVVGQFMLSKEEKHIQHLFTPTEAVTGRLMIAFNTAETHDQQVIFMDKISVFPAAVYAYSVTIGGSPFLDKNIVGNYGFSSNFGAVDASSYRWLICDTPNGIFMPIAGEIDNVLSITSSMLNKYVKFEVTPVSLSGPVVGDSAISSAIFIGEPISSGVNNNKEPESLPSSPSSPETGIDPAPTKAEIHALNIQNIALTAKGVFFDLQQHWAIHEIELLTSAGVLQGKGNGMFAPEERITRAEFSAILARAFQLAPIFYEGNFTDVKNSNWYAGAVAVVTKYGIAQGTGENTFSPDLPISREEMAAMILRAYRKTGASAKTSSLAFSDQSEISHWAQEDVRHACALGLMNGFTDGSFKPKQNATRAETAVVIVRMLSCVAENAG